MEAGPKLDALVAEKVMGKDPDIWEPGDSFVVIDQNTIKIAKPYSTDITAAWQVVEKLRLAVIPCNDGQWYAGKDEYDHDLQWYEVIMYVDDPHDHHSARFVHADTGPLAICLAALKAVGVQLTE